MVESYAAKVDSLNKKIDDLEKQLQDQGQREQKSKSYAAATAESPMAKVENKNVVLVYPKKMCSKEVKRQLQKVIQPAKLDIGVKRVRKVNHGSVMVECLREGIAQ